MPSESCQVFVSLIDVQPAIDILIYTAQVESAVSIAAIPKIKPLMIIVEIALPTKSIE